MKKLICSLAAIMLLVSSVFALSSCSKEDDVFIYFSLGVTNYSYQGSDYSLVLAYMTAVEEAYCEALGMSSETKCINFNSGDFKTRSSEMKSRFDSAKLPASPTVSGSYSFTITIYGTDNATDLSSQKTVAAKTFAN